MKIERGVYKHYKGGLYFVHGVVKHSETAEELVHYESAETGQEYVRPIDQFKGEVEGKKRFTKLDVTAPEFEGGRETRDANFFDHVGQSGKLTFFFDNPHAVRVFKSWLLCSGEQHYWLWALEAENETDENVRVHFRFHTGTNQIETVTLPNDTKEGYSVDDGYDEQM